MHEVQKKNTFGPIPTQHKFKAYLYTAFQKKTKKKQKLFNHKKNKNKINIQDKFEKQN